MNKQRLLWVILSITLLVIIILAGGLWLMRESKTVPVSEVAKEPPTKFDAFEYINGNVPVTGLQKEGTTKTDGSDKSIVKQDISIGEKQDSTFESYLKKGKTSSDITKKQPSTSVTQPNKNTGMTTTKTQTKTTPKSANQPAVFYWIQTGSYKSKSKAENCNAVLIENGLSGRILTRTIHNETYFRVRIGPYANMKEAEKFLTWIKKIDGLEESYISVERSVN
jgi:cell division protein FtsN